MTETQLGLILRLDSDSDWDSTLTQTETQLRPRLRLNLDLEWDFSQTKTQLRLRLRLNLNSDSDSTRKGNVISRACDSVPRCPPVMVRYGTCPMLHITLTIILGQAWDLPHICPALLASPQLRCGILPATTLVTQQAKIKWRYKRINFNLPLVRSPWGRSASWRRRLTNCAIWTHFDHNLNLKQKTYKSSVCTIDNSSTVSGPQCLEVKCS